jgi:DNA recombination protein RmuC
MPTLLSLASLLLGLLALLGILALWMRRQPSPDLAPLDQRLAALLDEIRRSEQSSRDDSARLREELGRRAEANLTATLARQDEARRETLAQIDTFRGGVEQRLRESREALDSVLSALRAELGAAAQGARAETRQLFSEFQTSIQQALGDTRSAQSSQLVEFQSSIRNALAESRREQATQLTDFSARLDSAAQASAAASDSLRQSVDSRLRETAETTAASLARHRTEAVDSAAAARAETRQQFAIFQQTAEKSLTDSRTSQGTQLSDFANRLGQLNTGINEQLDRARQSLDLRLSELQSQNSAKLDEMRQTVDQRLQATLEQRLGESFKLVGDNLERVIRSLGEMQQMAASVGDLKRVLTNVKTRGSWGEVQLGNLLSQTLTAEQYSANVAPKPDSRELVEFAIRLPGHEPGGNPVWLPIDAKFPTEDYDRIALAAERADADAVAIATKALSDRVWGQAKTIAEKYIAPPHTTDFALLFLPTEGLYAEVLRQPGLASEIQQKFRVVLAGPTTLTALLNSLQMGFRTLAIERRASDVWQVLGAVKTEFGKFGDTLDKVRKKLDSASQEIEATGVRTRAINRRLREVESLPSSEAERILPPDPAATVSDEAEIA